jgi:hypothetical protein
MLHDPNPKFKRLISGCCQHCGAKFYTAKRTGRPQLFCGKKCRQAEFRFISGLRRSGFEPEGTVCLIRDETPQKSEVGSKVSKVESGYRPPVEILGRGHRWSNSATIDRETLAEIIETEIGGDRFTSAGKPTKRTNNPPDSNRPANPYLDEIPHDLLIPAFLQRRPS